MYIYICNGIIMISIISSICVLGYWAGLDCSVSCNHRWLQVIPFCTL